MASMLRRALDLVVKAKYSTSRDKVTQLNRIESELQRVLGIRTAVSRKSKDKTGKK